MIIYYNKMYSISISSSKIWMSVLSTTLIKPEPEKLNNYWVDERELNIKH